MLNAAALTEPFAIAHLAADLCGNHSDVAIISETHFKEKHCTAAVSIAGYTLYRRDRTRRRGGGVTVYVRSTLQSSEWKHKAEDDTFEMLWVRIGYTFLAAIYHPPNPVYQTESLLNYIDACVEELSDDFPLTQIVISGDVNQLRVQ